MSDIIGTKVMVLFHSAKGLENLGIDADSKYCRVVGFDNFGLWVENPNYEETPIRGPDGALIPPDERERRMTLETDKGRRGGFARESLLERFGGEVKGHVHGRAVFGGRGARVELGRIDRRVEPRGFLLVDLLERGGAAMSHVST